MPTAQQACVIMSPQALHTVDVHLLSDIRKELGGFLLGTSYQSNGRLYVEVEAALIAHSDKNGPVHFTFTADSWARAHQEREEFYPELEIVGWFHSHPDLGVFYSSDDVTVHTTAFSSLWHVGLVVDPVRREACLFGWRLNEDGQPDEIIPLKGFVEFSPSSNRSAIDWQWTHGTGLADLQRRAYSEGMRRAVGLGGQYGSTQQPVDIVGTMMRVSGVTLAMATLLFMILLTPFYLRNASLERSVVALGDYQRATMVADGLISCPDPRIQILSPLPRTVVSDQVDSLPIWGTVQMRRTQNNYVVQVRDLKHYPMRHDVTGEWFAPDDWYRDASWDTIETSRRSRTANVLGYLNPQALGPGTYDIRVVLTSLNNAPIESTACSMKLIVSQSDSDQIVKRFLGNLPVPFTPVEFPDHRELFDPVDLPSPDEIDPFALPQP